jgi:hypothetical protein
MEEFNRFFTLARYGRFTVTDLCEQFGIGRKTDHNYLEHFATLGSAGLTRVPLQDAFLRTSR